MIIKSDHKEATILGKSEVTTGTIALNMPKATVC